MDLNPVQSTNKSAETFSPVSNVNNSIPVSLVVMLVTSAEIWTTPRSLQWMSLNQAPSLAASKWNAVSL